MNECGRDMRGGEWRREVGADQGEGELGPRKEYKWL